MIKIPPTPYKFHITKQGNDTLIFDEIRKKNVLLTPEEWVRQNFVRYLITELKYPPSRIAIEKEFALHSLKKRFDILVYTQAFDPFMLIECKSHHQKLHSSAVEQVLSYNMKFHSRYILITNLLSTYCMYFNSKSKKLETCSKLPVYTND